MEDPREQEPNAEFQASKTLVREGLSSGLSDKSVLQVMVSITVDLDGDHNSIHWVVQLFAPITFLNPEPLREPQ